MFFYEDITRGTEVVSIFMINEVDYKKVPFFRYINRMIYPKWCNSVKVPMWRATKLMNVLILLNDVVL
jgi:hypothetical protein